MTIRRMAPVHLFCPRRYASKSPSRRAGDRLRGRGALGIGRWIGGFYVGTEDDLFGVDGGAEGKAVGVSTAIATKTQRFRNKWKRISNACAPNTKYLLRGNVPNRPKKK
jgi:hypothetical protein